MSTHTITLHRVLRAPPERVYRAFLDPDAMAKFLPPHGFTGRVLEMTQDKYGWTFWYVIMSGFGILGGLAMILVIVRQKRMARGLTMDGTFLSWRGRCNRARYFWSVLVISLILTVMNVGSIKL